VANGKLVFNDIVSFKFRCDGKVQIGYNSFSNSKFLVGQISYINVFATALPMAEMVAKTTGPIPNNYFPTKNSLTTTDG